MGVIWAKLRRKKTNTEILERLDKDIRSIEDYSRNTEQKHKKIVGQFLLFSIGLYTVSTFLFFFYFLPSTLKEQVLYFIPFFLAPFIILCTKKLLTWYYNRKLTKNQKKLVDLRDEKKKMLEQIMETETYKVARSLLEKFAPEQVRKVTIPVTSSELTPLRAPNTPDSNTGVRNRFPGGRPMGRPSFGNIPPSRSSFGPTGGTTASPPRISIDATPAPVNNQIVPQGNNQVILPQAILPRERTILDRMVEYLVGDGPSNRYALICNQCSSHNGMALKQEFEYISFKCCYCHAFNPAHKKRPVAPRLELEAATPPTHLSDSSDSEKNSGSDSEPEGDVPSPPSSDVSAKTTDVETLYAKELTKTSDTEQASDFDKLSDIELKNSDSDTVEKPDDDHQTKQDSQD